MNFTHHPNGTTDIGGIGLLTLAWISLAVRAQAQADGKDNPEHERLAVALEEAFTKAEEKNDYYAHND